MDPAEYERAGLYDPDAPNAADRLALLEFLTEQGVTLEQMTNRQRHQGSLTSAAGDLLIRPGERISLRRVAEDAGMNVETAQRVWRAIGFPEADPDAPDFTEADVEAFRAFRLASELFGEYGILYFTRILGSSMARIAEGAVTGFLANVEAPLAEAGAGELALARANLAAVEALTNVPAVMDTVFRHHVEAAIRLFRAARGETPVFDRAAFAVGFVDLVGYTSASRELDSRALATLIAEFESRAFDVAAAHGGRVVKLIGDEVMFVALEAAAACEIALQLLEPFADHSPVTPRAGLAVGPVMTRGGDYYGPIVNLASRIADLAIPDEILVSTDVRDQVAKETDRYAFAPAGRRMLKGFDEPVELYSLARAE
jgi:adenylate cyclase